MSAASLPRPETSPMRALNTSSIASCSAGNAAGALAVTASMRCAQPSRTSGQSTQASRKLGATGLPSPTRRSVSCSAAHERRGRRARSTHDVEQRDRCRGARPELAQLRDRGQRVAGLQQLEHLVEQAALRHVGQQAGDSISGAAVLGSSLKPSVELGREADGADDAHRVLAVARAPGRRSCAAALLRVLDAAVVVDHDLAARGRSTSR